MVKVTELLEFLCCNFLIGPFPMLIGPFSMREQASRNIVESSNYDRLRKITDVDMLVGDNDETSHDENDNADETS